MELSDLCPVTALICLASMLRSESTVTDVARTQWLVRCGAIPADSHIFFFMFSSVLFPTWELQYHNPSFCGWNYVDTSLGSRCLRKLSKVFTGQRFQLGTSNILPSDSSANHLDDFWMQNGCEIHSSVALEVYSEFPTLTCLR